MKYSGTLFRKLSRDLELPHESSVDVILEKKIEPAIPDPSFPQEYGPPITQVEKEQIYFARLKTLHHPTLKGGQ